MTRSQRHKKAAFWHMLAGLLLLQLGLRGAAIWLNETGGNTFDVAGAPNSAQYGWLLIPESWTIDLVTRFSFWLLIPASVVLFARAAILFARPSEATTAISTFGSRLAVAVLALFAVWTCFIGVWGIVLMTASESPKWWPPAFIFPPILYLLIPKAWPLFLIAAAVSGVSAVQTYRARMNKRPTAGNPPPSPRHVR